MHLWEQLAATTSLPMWVSLGTFCSIFAYLLWRYGLVGVLFYGMVWLVSESRHSVTHRHSVIATISWVIHCVSMVRTGSNKHPVRTMETRVVRSHFELMRSGPDGGHSVVIRTMEAAGTYQYAPFKTALWLWRLKLVPYFICVLHSRRLAVLFRSLNLFVYWWITAKQCSAEHLYLIGRRQLLPGTMETDRTFGSAQSMFP